MSHISKSNDLRKCQQLYISPCVVTLLAVGSNSKRHTWDTKASKQGHNIPRESASTNNFLHAMDKVVAQ